MIYDDALDDIYVNEHGKCAYIAGAISVHTDNLDMALCNANVQYEAICSDVFCVKSCDTEVIKKLLKERLKARQTLEAEQIAQIDAEVDALRIVESDMPMEETIYQFYKDRQDVNHDAISEAIKKYCTYVEYYLKKPKKVYVALGESFDINGEIAQTYFWMLFNIVFVESEDYLLLFLHGSDE